MTSQISVSWEIHELSKELFNQYDKDSFDCGHKNLNDYIQKHAWASHKSGYAKTYIATLQSEKKIVGYYSVSATNIHKSCLPESMIQGMPNYPVGAAMLGRLAVIEIMQGQGLGKELLLHAMHTVLKSSKIIGILGIVVDAIDEKAKKFYLKYGFTQLIDNEMTLFIPMKKIKQQFGES